LNLKYSTTDLKEIFNYLDLDKNGFIAYEEFSRFSEEKRKDIDPFLGKHNPRRERSQNTEIKNQKDNSAETNIMNTFNKRKAIF